MSYAQWHPTGQIVWVKKQDGATVLCQMLMEVIPGAKGPQPTGNAQWREVPTIDEPDGEKVPAAQETPKSEIIV